MPSRAKVVTSRSAKRTDAKAMPSTCRCRMAETMPLSRFGSPSVLASSTV